MLPVNPCVNTVSPVTVPPLKDKKSPLVNPVTVNVVPELFLKVIVPFEYVPPVTKVSVYPVKNPVTWKVPPLLFVNVATPLAEL